MKTKLLGLGLIFLGIIILTNCKPPAYVANKVNTPMITDKNDFTADVGVGASGLNIQTAYSPAKHLGIMANFATEFIFSKKENKKYHKVNFGDIGFGYYHKFGDFFMVDLYGGGGLGFSKIMLDSNNRTDLTNVNYYRLFAQPSIAFTSNIFKLDLACRFNYINAYQAWGTSSSAYSGNVFCYEPALTIKLGYKWIMAYLQWAVSLPFKDIDNNVYSPNVWNFTGGLSFSFNFGKKVLK